MNESEEGVNCPCCGGRIERFPDQDGSCDYCCERCTWHQFVPADVNTTEMEDLSTAAKSETLAGLTIDLELLKQQAA
ncbi:MAG: hypothetical protein KAX19_02380, partial [Candidatus Brocadiae bacterium]|nr:hypothetical protein [Candidatus Brocadiia bacterium]